MKTLEIKYLGKDNWNRSVYETIHGTILKNTSLNDTPNQSNLSSTLNNMFDGEPDIPLKYKKERYNFIVVLYFNK